MALKSREEWIEYYDGRATILTGVGLPPKGGARFLPVLKTCSKAHQLALWDRNNLREYAGNEELAQAEHYLFARLLTVLGGPLLAVPGLIATVGYDVLKFIAYRAGGNKALQAISHLTGGKGRTTPSSPAQIKAGGDGQGQRA
ncbi:MAG: hypothetical protein NT013_27555 [Planctomycetia bacterium]|nr:hypothetical protein [Planctomycetia bacterium]